MADYFFKKAIRYYQEPLLKPVKAPRDIDFADLGQKLMKAHFKKASGEFELYLEGTDDKLHKVAHAPTLYELEARLPIIEDAALMEKIKATSAKALAHLDKEGFVQENRYLLINRNNSRAQTHYETLKDRLGDDYARYVIKEKEGKHEAEAKVKFTILSEDDGTLRDIITEYNAALKEELGKTPPSERVVIRDGNLYFTSHNRGEAKLQQMLDYYQSTGNRIVPTSFGRNRRYEDIETAFPRAYRQMRESSGKRRGSAAVINKLHPLIKKRYNSIAENIGIPTLK